MTLLYTSKEEETERQINKYNDQKVQNILNTTNSNVGSKLEQFKDVVPLASHHFHELIEIHCSRSIFVNFVNDAV